MILFLRNKKRQSIVDIDCYVKTEDGCRFVELHSSVIIDTYSKFLLENLDRKDEIIKDFSEIDELRGWLWENYFMGGDNDPEKYTDIIGILRNDLNKIGIKYHLTYVED